MKVFNSLVALAIIFLTYQTALKLNLKQALLAALFVIFSPLFYILTFSGLTEPLFALFTILGVYLCTRENYSPAAVVISFLPYVRSEGLIILGVFALYFVLKKQWKMLPLLLAGSALYAIAGFFIHGTFFWVFTEIPYATMDSVYGEGKLFHFVEELINVTGIPIYVLFWIGFLVVLVMLFRKFQLELHVLIFGSFACFFVAHTLFWYLGIFNSMGLKRVLIGIIPLIALISLQGYNFIVQLHYIRPIVKKVLSVLLIAYVVIFPFTDNPSAINWKKDMMLGPDQKLAIQASEMILKNTTPDHPVFYNYNYLSLTLNRDHFDPEKRKQISAQNLQTMNPGDLLVWENLYAGPESGLKKEVLDKDPELSNLGVYTFNEKGRGIIFSIYKKK
jgi:hypothetical protein